MRTLLIASFALLAFPVNAAECYYESGHDLGRILFSDDTATLELVGEAPEMCSVNQGDDGGDLLVCPSDDGDSEMFNFAGKEIGSSERDLLVLWGHVWYRQCFQPT